MTSAWDIRSDSPLLGLGNSGRARFTVRHDAATALTEVPLLLAGAAEADITPPPGMPKAGYSANAHDGNGFRTRLRARILHLRAGTSSVALVQCDLLGGSAVLQHLVARAVASATDVGLDGVFIGATHTHAGPGQFLGTDFYNRFASNRAGFDPGYAQFLVEEIAGAVVAAVETRRPACLATGTTEVWGWTRNRSLAAHLANATVDDKRTAPHRKFAAVNPTLHVVRVDEADGGPPVAAMVLFSVHGTGISVRAKEYNADLWAYVTGTLSDRVLSESGTRAVVGAVQATHADIAPAIRPGAAGYLEAERVGSGIGKAAGELWVRLEKELSPNVSVDSALLEVDLDRSPGATVAGMTLPRRPAVGAALVAGAHENTTAVIHRLPPFRPGSPRPHRPADEQGAKWVLASRWLQPLILPLGGFPRIIPVQIVRLGQLAIVGVPFEVTVEAGRRIRSGVASAMSRCGVSTVAISSVANEYAGYVTTAEEYGLQHYEGGHTLYGPTTAAWVAAHSAALAGAMAGRGEAREPRRSVTRSFDLRAKRYMPLPTGERVERRRLASPRFVDPTATTDGYWQFEWQDVAPGDLEWNKPLVRVEAQEADGGWATASRKGQHVDDGGWHVEVSLGDSPPRSPTHAYAARWFNPALGPERAHRFVLAANRRQPELASEPFS